MKSQKSLRARLSRRLLRPFVYMAFVRLVLGVTLALLLDELIVTAAPTRRYAFAFLAALLLCMAWLAYLRLDGAKLPTLDRALFEWRRKPERAYGDMIDYVDETTRNWEELEEDEKNVCRLGADVLAGGLFLLASVM